MRNVEKTREEFIWMRRLTLRICQHKNVSRVINDFWDELDDDDVGGDDDEGPRAPLLSKNAWKKAIPRLVTGSMCN